MRRTLPVPCARTAVDNGSRAPAATATKPRRFGTESFRRRVERHRYYASASGETVTQARCDSSRTDPIETPADQGDQRFLRSLMNDRLLASSTNFRSWPGAAVEIVRYRPVAVVRRFVARVSYAAVAV